MPASGKSTAGVLIAKKTGYGFIDTDLLIQKREGALLLEKPTLIKRPVVEWPDGRITTGLDAVLVAEARS